LYAEENLSDKHRDRFATLKGMNLKVGRARAIRESLRELWGAGNVAAGQGVLEALVQVGHSFATGAGAGGGLDDQAPVGQYRYLLPARDHQCRE
jgi:hypothetical protein